MDYLQFFILFLAAFIGGGLNATIGGGWFIVFPCLIYEGLQPVSGNATTTTTLWSGHVASIYGEKKSLGIARKNLSYLWGISAVGGLTGAILLIVFSHETFEMIAPYLLLCSWLMFTFNEAILRYVESKIKAGKPFEYSHKKLAPLFLLSVYGSYFGAGMGMMFIALFSYYGMTDTAAINQLKNRVISVNNGIAIVVFIWSGLLYWPFAIIMILGAIIGGYYGAAIGKKMNIVIIKKIVIVIGSVVTLYFLNLLH